MRFSFLNDLAAKFLFGNQMGIQFWLYSKMCLSILLKTFQLTNC